MGIEPASLYLVALQHTLEEKSHGIILVAPHVVSEMVGGLGPIHGNEFGHRNILAKIFIANILVIVNINVSKRKSLYEKLYQFCCIIKLPKKKPKKKLKVIAN